MTATTLTGAVDPVAARRHGLFRRFLRRPAGAISLTIFLLIVLVAIFAPLIAPQDPNFVDLAAAKAPPGPGHLLGADSNGRDILSRLIYGAQTTLWGALVTILTALVLGVPAGVVAGYFGGVVDRILTWISDAVQSVPGMIILLVVAAGSRSNFELIMVTVGVLLAPGYFRISRSTTMTVRGEPYIDAARVSGLTDARILSRHVVKSVYAPVIIQTALTAGIAMGMQAGLQFLGVGDPNVPNWGAMMNEGFRLVLSTPLILLWPSAALGITIAALAVMGSTFAEVVQDRSAPRRRRRGAKARGGSTVEAAVGMTGTLSTVPENSAVRIENLHVTYDTDAGPTEVVHGISLDVADGEIVGIVGESGSGKSQTVFSLLDLLPEGGVARADGIWVDGHDVTRLPQKRRHELLGREIGYIPQEPMSNLDPSYTIRRQLTEPLRTVRGMSKREADELARDLLVRVGIVDPDRVLRSYPHQISGGMAQRVLIAGAISGRPKVLVADEPTTALDVTVQAEVLELLRGLQRELGMAVLIVTHNFGVVADLCDRVVVMRSGSIVETGEVRRLFAHPEADYTRELIDASLDAVEGREQLDADWRASREEATV